MHEVLVNRLGGLSLPRKSVVRLTDRPDMTLDVYHGRKTTIQHKIPFHVLIIVLASRRRFSFLKLFDILFIYFCFEKIGLVLAACCTGSSFKLLGDFYVHVFCCDVMFYWWVRL